MANQNTQEIFVIKNLDNNKYTQTNREGEVKFTADIEGADQYSSYQEAQGALSNDNDYGIQIIPTGLYQIEKVFKKS